MIEIREMSAINGNRSCSLFSFFWCETKAVEKPSNSTEDTPINHQTTPESERKNKPKTPGTTPTRPEPTVALGMNEEPEWE